MRYGLANTYHNEHIAYIFGQGLVKRHKGNQLWTKHAKFDFLVSKTYILIQEIVEIGLSCLNFMHKTIFSDLKNGCHFEFLRG